MTLIELIQLIVSILLYFAIFFGISFILTMLLRGTWIMAILYPFIILFITGESKFFDYFSTPKVAFSALGSQITSMSIADIIILLSGLVGTIVSGIVIKILRKNGYQMF